MDSSYQEMGGSYVSNEDDQDLHALFVAPEADAAGLSASRIYGLDLFTGGRLVKPLESEVSMPSFIERVRSEEHKSELQSLMSNSYAVFCWKNKKIYIHIVSISITA